MQSVLGTAAASTTKSPSWGHSDKRLSGKSSDQQEPLQHLGSGARQRAGQGRERGRGLGTRAGERGAWVTENGEQEPGVGRAGGGGAVQSAHHRK